MTTKHDSISAAMAAFQAELPGVGKDSVNPHFKSRYADLADMSKAILPVLAKHGLAFTTLPTLNKDGLFVLQYSLFHESGGSITGEYPLPSGGNEQQKGSAITYARRYCLGAVTGVAADEDDDGNAASQAKQVSPPPSWRKVVADATGQADLTTIYQQASAEGWANPEVMQALTARKTALQAEAQGAAADA